jgi:hypothetical protein
LGSPTTTHFFYECPRPFDCFTKLAPEQRYADSCVVRWICHSPTSRAPEVPIVLQLRRAMPEICDLPVWSPLYLVCSTQQCPRCGRAADVAALVPERYDDTLDGSAEAAQKLGPLGWLPPILLTPVSRLSPGLADAVQALAPRYRRVRSPDGADRFANHCECGTLLGDNEVYGPGAAFDVGTYPEMRARGIEVMVLPLERAERITCAWSAPAGVAFILRDWWRDTADELLARLQTSAKPTGRPYPAAVGRALECLAQAEDDLQAWRDGRDPFQEGDYPAPGPDEATSLEPWADVQVWEPLFLMTSVYQCWKCGESSPVAAVLAERYVDLIGSERQARLDPPEETQHVVMLCNIERMSPGLEQALADAAPQIRPGRSRTASRTYYMNHCRACGIHFGDFFLGDADGSLLGLVAGRDPGQGNICHPAGRERDAAAPLRNHGLRRLRLGTRAVVEGAGPPLAREARGTRRSPVTVIRSRACACRRRAGLCGVRDPDRKRTGTARRSRGGRTLNCPATLSRHPA